jgi:glycosyltransferase involved in cell wall biosynthesis
MAWTSMRTGDEVRAEDPLISVVTPTHNRAQLLQRAMASVLAQRWQAFEWIVVDDGSQDETPAVLRSCADPRVRFRRLDPNRGVAAARNAGIEAARGAFVAFLDDDDEYLPDYLEAVVGRIRSSTRVPDVIWSGVTRVYEYPDGTRRERSQVWRRGSDDDGMPGSVAYLTQLNMSCGLCVRRESLLRVGLFDAAFRVSEDLDLLLRLAAAGCAFDCVARPLIRVHVHAGLSLSRSSRSAVMASANARLIAKNQAFLERHPALWMHFHDMLAGDYYRAGERVPARTVIRQMLRRAPWRLRTWEKLLRFEVSRRLRERGG